MFKMPVYLTEIPDSIIIRDSFFPSVLLFILILVLPCLIIQTVIVNWCCVKFAKLFWGTNEPCVLLRKRIKRPKVARLRNKTRLPQKNKKCMK